MAYWRPGVFQQETGRVYLWCADDFTRPGTVNIFSEILMTSIAHLVVI